MSFLEKMKKKFDRTRSLLLKELEDELDPQDFWRVHRSALVRVSAIAQVTKDDRGRHLLGIRGVQERIEVSRNHTHLFQQM